VPTYGYACTACDHRFEIVQSFTEDSLTECPQCQGRLRKLFNAVGVVFKGSGFYRTDSRNDSRRSSGSHSGKHSGSHSGKDSTSGTTSSSDSSGSTSSAPTGSSPSSAGTKTATKAAVTSEGSAA
jgi:putative FmdB family regulatory protein